MNALWSRLFKVFLGLALITGPLGVTALKRTVCRDGDGNEVDSWIVIKRSNSLEYVSSIFKDGKQFTQPLRDGFLINDVKSSPFLQTVYTSKPLKDNADIHDNRLILAWNDQQPHNNKGKAEKKTEQKLTDSKGHADRLADVDPNLEETKLGDGKDMYGWTETEKFAHSKGILGLSVQVDKNNKDEGLAEFYLVTHSFPLTPNGKFVDGELVLTDSDDDDSTSVDDELILIKRRFVSDDPKRFFGKNISSPHSKAQHALCISMQQKVKLKNGIIVFDRSKMDLNRMNLFALLNGLDIIGPSLTLTNYVPWLPHFKIYHQLFDIRESWSSKKILPGDKIAGKNLARVIPRPKSNEEILPHTVPDYSDHAFPLWPSRVRVRVGTKGEILGYSRSKNAYSSLRNPQQIYATRCRVWNAAKGGHRDPGCFASAMLTSTGSKPIVFHFLAKNARVRADTDDIIGSRLLPKHDLDLAQSKQPTFKKHVAFMVIHQSWVDHATFTGHVSNLVNTERYHAVAYHYNNLGIRLPHEKGLKVPQSSNGKDHSKWFVSYLLGKPASFKAIAGVTDLNRNRKATVLTNDQLGRGGFFFISSDSDFVRFWLALEPIMEDNSNFANVPIDYFTKDYYDEDEVPISNVKGISKTGDVMQIELNQKRGAEYFALPYCDVPNTAEALLKKNTEEQCKGDILQTPIGKKSIVVDTFLTGSPNFRASIYTPSKMDRRWAARKEQYADTPTKRQLFVVPQSRNPNSTPKSTNSAKTWSLLSPVKTPIVDTNRSNSTAPRLYKGVGKKLFSSPDDSIDNVVMQVLFKSTKDSSSPAEPKKVQDCLSPSPGDDKKDVTPKTLPKQVTEQKNSNQLVTVTLSRLSMLPLPTNVDTKKSTTIGKLLSPAKDSVTKDKKDGKKTDKTKSTKKNPVTKDKKDEKRKDKTKSTNKSKVKNAPRERKYKVSIFSSNSDKSSSLTSADDSSYSLTAHKRNTKQKGKTKKS